MCNTIYFYLITIFIEKKEKENYSLLVNPHQKVNIPKYNY